MKVHFLLFILNYLHANQRNINRSKNEMHPSVPLPTFALFLISLYSCIILCVNTDACVPNPFGGPEQKCHLSLFSWDCVWLAELLRYSVISCVNHHLQIHLSPFQIFCALLNFLVRQWWHQVKCSRFNVEWRNPSFVALIVGGKRYLVWLNGDYRQWQQSRM